MTKKDTGSIILRNQQEVFKATGKAFFIQPKIRSLIKSRQFMLNTQILQFSTSTLPSADGFP